MQRGEYGAADFGIITDSNGEDLAFTMEELVIASRRQPPKVESKIVTDAEGRARRGPKEIKTEPQEQVTKEEPVTEVNKNIPKRLKTIGDYGRTTVGQTKSRNRKNEQNARFSWYWS